jgi:hypothetical protein
LSDNINDAGMKACGCRKEQLLLIWTEEKISACSRWVTGGYFASRFFAYPPKRNMA